MKVIAEKANLAMLGEGLAADVGDALQAGVDGGVFYPRGCNAREIFQRLVGESIQDIEGHPRGILLQRFLREGPYEDRGRIPKAVRGLRLSDEETAQAISFIHSFMINAFQGRLAEALAVVPCCKIVREMQAEGTLPEEARVYFGDSVSAGQRERKGRYKGADLHILTVRGSTVELTGVGEIKSYRPARAQVAAQLMKHVARARMGLVIEGSPFKSAAIHTGRKPPPITIVVTPSTWRLPRAFRLVEKKGGGTIISVEPGVPPVDEDAVTRTGPRSWRVSLRWSREALAAAAYEMTFWYMAEVGEIIYRDSSPWPGMIPQEAGRNAAKQMLYFSIMRARTRHEFQRAVALYNAYGFGYALGTSFKDRKGGRAMLWPEDLREILETGQTKHRARLVP